MDKVEETKSHSKKQTDETEALCRYKRQHRHEYTMVRGKKTGTIKRKDRRVNLRDNIA